MVIVFGAAGFVGTYLMDAIKQKVLAVDVNQRNRKYFALHKIPFCCLDITNPKIFKYLPKNDVSCVINLASCQPANVSSADFDPVNYIKVNTIGTLNILKYCVKNNIPRMIQLVSHRSLLGHSFEKDIYFDDASYDIAYDSDFSEFSISEMAAIEMIKCYQAKYNLRTIMLRVPAIFGYGPHLEGYQNGQYCKTGFQKFIEDAEADQPLQVWGDRNASRDIVYIKDVVSAILHAIAENINGANGMYNISSGHALSLLEEAKAIQDVFGSPNSPKKIVFVPSITNDITPCHYSINKAKRDLKWSPQYSFKDMLMDYKKERESGRFDFLLRKER